MHGSCVLCCSRLTKKSHRQFLDNIAQQLEIKSNEDWYNIDIAKIKAISEGSSLLSPFDSCSTSLITASFPEHNWLAWKFTTVPRGFWLDVQSQRSFLDWFGAQLNYSQYDSWYNVTADDILEYGGRSLMREHGKLLLILQNVFPEVDWKPWLMKNIPNDFWKDLTNQKKFLDWLGHQLGYTSYELYYKLTPTIVQSNGGTSLLSLYHHSVRNLLKTVYPNFLWKSWLFDVKTQQRYPPNYWKSVENQRAFCDKFASSVGIINPSDWYQVKVYELQQYGARPLLLLYNNSLFDLLKTVYPNQTWYPWLFPQVLNTGFFWDDLSNVKAYIKWLEGEFNIKQLDDWYNISPRLQIFQKGGFALIRKYHGLLPILKKIYPDQQWNDRFFASRRKSEGLLLDTVTSLFPDATIHSPYKHPQLKYQESERNMELDMFLPAFRLAFEYQGEYHFESDHKWFGSEKIKQMDCEKLEACQKLGITLLRIPYWWNYDTDSIIATIKYYRPDLLINHKVPEGVEPIDQSSVDSMVVHK